MIPYSQIQSGNNDDKRLTARLLHAFLVVATMLLGGCGCGASTETNPLTTNNTTVNSSSYNGPNAQTEDIRNFQVHVWEPLRDSSRCGGCHIDGTVNGSVTADPDSKSALSISEGGNIDGGVTVPYVVLNGIVRGDVFANQRVELGPTARVIGNVYYNLIEMAIGAEVNGKLIHRPAGRAEAETAQDPDSASS